ncbi:venom allergen 5 [Dendroctonus ponderosae]
MKNSVSLYLMGLTWLNWRIATISGANLLQQPFNNTFKSRSLKAIDWCALNCPKGPNIACTLKGDCLTIAAPCQFLKLDKARLLDLHNQLRNLFATGNEPQAKGLQVADMMVVEWDDDLAFTASCNLKTCPSSMEHDTCHITPNFMTSGQNLAWAAGVTDCSEQSLKMVHNWYNEVRELSADQLHSWGKSFQFQSGTGHFTQLIWSKVTHIGCAAFEKDLESGRKECMMACNYGPTGNVLGRAMFKEGPPTSACPRGLVANSKHAGLCGAARRNRSFLEAVGAAFPCIVALQRMFSG